MKVIEDTLIIGDEQVIRNRFYEKPLGKNGVEIVTAGVYPGGAKSGRTMAEWLYACSSVGILPEDEAIATSSGSYNKVADMAGQMHIVPDVYEKMSWFNPEMLWNMWMNRDYSGLEYLRANLIKRLDVEAFLKSKTNLTIAVADMDANARLFNAKDPHINIFDLMFASSALYPLAQPIEIKGEKFVDGGYTRDSAVAKWRRRLRRRFPRKREIETLYVANRPHPQHAHPWEDWVFNWLVMTYLMPRNLALAEGAMSIPKKIEKAAEIFERNPPHGRRCAIFPLPDENIFPNEWRTSVLRKRGDLTRRRRERFLKAMKPVIWV